MSDQCEPDIVEVIHYTRNRVPSTMPKPIVIEPSIKCVKCHRKAATRYNPICKYCNSKFEI